MSKEDMIALARQAGFENIAGGIDGLNELEAFAKLVEDFATAKEREGLVRIIEANIADEREAIAVWLEQDCEEQYLADRVRAGDFAKEKGHTEDCAALGNDCPDHLPPSLVGVGKNNSTTKQEQGEPFGYWFSDDPAVVAYAGSGFFKGSKPPNDAVNIIPLYTTPQRKPLTDEQIFAIGKELGLKCRLGGNTNIDIDYARAIEAAHGIKE
jgi:hypothetical protein